MYLVEGRLAGVLAALLIAAAGVALSGAGPDFGAQSRVTAAPAAAVSAAATSVDTAPCAQAARPPA